MQRLKAVSLPVPLDLYAYAGDDFGKTLRFYTDIEKTIPQPMSGTWLAQIRQSVIDPTVLQTFVVDATNALSGSVLLKIGGDLVSQFITKPDGKRIPSFTGRWDVQFTPTDPDDSPFYGKKTLYAGDWVVYSDTSRAA